MLILALFKEKGNYITLTDEKGEFLGEIHLIDQSAAVVKLGLVLDDKIQAVRSDAIKKQ